MADYAVRLKRSALKEFDGLEARIATRVLAAIRKLADDPMPPGCKKLRNTSDQWRIRIGDYRVVYVVDSREKRVMVVAIGHRKDVYT